MTNRREFLRSATLDMSFSLLDKNVRAQVTAGAFSGMEANAKLERDGPRGTIAFNRVIGLSLIHI